MIKINDYVISSQPLLEILRRNWSGSPELLEFWSRPMKVKNIRDLYGVPWVEIDYPEPLIPGKSFRFPMHDVTRVNIESKPSCEVLTNTLNLDKSLETCPCKSRICFHLESNQ